MDRCKYQGCGKPAFHALKYRVPIQGMPEDVHKPIDVVIVMELCRRHAAEAKLADFDQPATRAYVAAQALLRRMPADFDRARLITIRIDGPEYQAILKGVAAKARRDDFELQQATSRYPVH